MLVVGGASLGIHIWLFFLLAGYRELVFRVGSLFPHHHDVADILVVGGGRVTMLTASMAVLGDPFTRVFLMPWSGTPEGVPRWPWWGGPPFVSPRTGLSPYPPLF